MTIVEREGRVNLIERAAGGDVRNDLRLTVGGGRGRTAEHPRLLARTAKKLENNVLVELSEEVLRAHDLLNFRRETRGASQRAGHRDGPQEIRKVTPLNRKCSKMSQHGLARKQ